MSSELIVITYPTPEDAERVVETVRRLQAKHLIDVEDLEYVTRDEHGAVSVFESINRPLAGAAMGAFWGTMLGKVFGKPLLGAGVGAAGGALLGRLVDDDDSIDDGFVRELSATLAPGSSAVFALVRRSTPDKVRAELGKFGGTLLHTSLSDEMEAQLQAALDEVHRQAVAVRSATFPTVTARRRRIVRRP
jgi:uncharacterized membrane protein